MVIVVGKVVVVIGSFLIKVIFVSDFEFVFIYINDFYFFGGESNVV